jgi:hypothetical protein
VLDGCETGADRERDKSVITSAEMKFMVRRTKYTRKDYTTNEIFISEFKISPVTLEILNVKKTNIWQ